MMKWWHQNVCGLIFRQGGMPPNPPRWLLFPPDDYSMSSWKVLTFNPTTFSDHLLSFLANFSIIKFCLVNYSAAWCQILLLIIY